MKISLNICTCNVRLFSPNFLIGIKQLCIVGVKQSNETKCNIYIWMFAWSCSLVIYVVELFENPQKKRKIHARWPDEKRVDRIAPDTLRVLVFHARFLWGLKWDSTTMADAMMHRRTDLSCYSLCVFLRFFLYICIKKNRKGWCNRFGLFVVYVIGVLYRLI